MNPDVLGALIQAPGAGGGVRWSTPRLILTPPLASYLCACVTYRTDSGPVRPTHAQISEALPGRGPKPGGIVPGSTLGNPISPPTLLRTLKGEPRSLTIPELPVPTLSPRRRQQRRAKAGFREVRLLPGLRTRVGQSLPVRPDYVSKGAWP